MNNLKNVDSSIVKEYTEGKGINKIAKEFSVAQNYVYKVLNSNNVKIRGRGSRKRPLSESQIAELIKLYNELTPLKELEKKFKTSKERIKDLLKDRGIETREYSLVKHVPTGTKFNRLTYLYELDERKNKRVYWRVLCDCGNEKDICKNDVVTQKTKSCGCLKKEKNPTIKDRKEYLLNILFKEYIKSAKSRKYSFNISFKKFKELVSKPCHYCCIENFSKRTDSITGFILYYTGIDRIDNSIGYEPDNIVPCCFECNRMKNTKHQDEFLAHIKKIYDNLIQS